MALDLIRNAARRLGESKAPVVLDLFAGAGGFSLGFQWAGYRTALAIDHDPMAVETLDANFGHHGAKVLMRDLALLSPEELVIDLEREGYSGVDVVVGGPPCQGWSLVGRGKLRSLNKRGGGGLADPRNGLYKRFIEYVGVLQPRAAVMENVPGMLSHNKQNMAELIASSMEDAGYSVAWSVLNAADFGVPQVRERLFFVGIRKDVGLTYKFPTALGGSGKRLYPEVTVWDAIGDLPPIPNGAKEWRRPYDHRRRRSSYAERMRHLADPATIFDHVCRTQNEQDVAAFRFLRQGGWYRDLPSSFKRYRDDIFEDKYKKLRAHRPSWCVTAHLSRDCYTHIHPTQARTISVREAARLQSFPDCFYFAGNMGDKFNLIGNAVPPVLVEKLALSLKSQMYPESKTAELSSSTKGR